MFSTIHECKDLQIVGRSDNKVTVKNEIAGDSQFLD